MIDLGHNYYYFLQGKASEDLVNEDGDTFLIRKDQPVILQVFPNRREVVVVPDIGVTGSSFIMALEMCQAFEVGDNLGLDPEDFH